jgi:hypothetical protein
MRKPSEITFKKVKPIRAAKPSGLKPPRPPKEIKPKGKLF